MFGERFLHEIVCLHCCRYLVIAQNNDIRRWNWFDIVLSEMFYFPLDDAELISVWFFVYANARFTSFLSMFASDFELHSHVRIHIMYFFISTGAVDLFVKRIPSIQVLKEYPRSRPIFAEKHQPAFRSLSVFGFRLDSRSVWSRLRGRILQKSIDFYFWFWWYPGENMPESQWLDFLKELVDFHGIFMVWASLSLDISSDWQYYIMWGMPGMSMRSFYANQRNHCLGTEWKAMGVKSQCKPMADFHKRGPEPSYTWHLTPIDGRTWMGNWGYNPYKWSYNPTYKW